MEKTTGEIGLGWEKGKNQEFSARQNLWCLLGIQVGMSQKQLDVYDWTLGKTSRLKT